MAPPAKRARHAEASTGDAPSAAECDKMVKRLSVESAHAVLTKLMAVSTEAVAAVEAELAQGDTQPVNLSYYASETSDIVHSLDGLRESQKFNLSGDLYEKLTSLVEECEQKLSDTHAFEAIVKIMQVVEYEAEGEIRKRMIGCGGLDYYIGHALAKLVEDMSAEEKASISNAVEDLHGVVVALEPDACGQELAEVVEKIRGKEGSLSLGD